MSDLPPVRGRGSWDSGRHPADSGGGVSRLDERDHRPHRDDDRRPGGWTGDRPRAGEGAATWSADANRRPDDRRRDDRRDGFDSHRRGEPRPDDRRRDDPTFRRPDDRRPDGRDNPTFRRPDDRRRDDVRRPDDRDVRRPDDRRRDDVRRPDGRDDSAFRRPDDRRPDDARRDDPTFRRPDDRLRDDARRPHDRRRDDPTFRRPDDRRRDDVRRPDDRRRDDVPRPDDRRRDDDRRREDSTFRRPDGRDLPPPGSRGGSRGGDDDRGLGRAGEDGRRQDPRDDRRGVDDAAGRDRRRGEEPRDEAAGGVSGDVVQRPPHIMDPDRRPPRPGLDRGTDRGVPPLAVDKSSVGVSRSGAVTSRTSRPSGPLPEVHIIGEIVGGTGFPSNVSCKWALEVGESWEWVNGIKGGQSHTDSPLDDGTVVWAHPIDLHYIAGSVHGWPKLLVQIWELDDAGRADNVGYGMCHVPAGAGSFRVECPTWRPVGTGREEISAHYLGGRPQLKSTSVLSTDSAQRFLLTTAGSGTVVFQLDVVLKNFESYSVDFKSV